MTWALIRVSVQRRSVLAFLGFRYDGQGGQWRRGAVSLSDQEIDAMSPQAFGQRVSRWRQQRRLDSMAC